MLLMFQLKPQTRPKLWNIYISGHILGFLQKEERDGLNVDHNTPPAKHTLLNRTTPHYPQPLTTALTMTPNNGEPSVNSTMSQIPRTSDYIFFLYVFVFLTVPFICLSEVSNQYQPQVYHIVGNKERRTAENIPLQVHI